MRTARPQAAGPPEAGRGGPPLPGVLARGRAAGLDAAIALVAWCGLVVAGRLLVKPLNDADPRIHIGNAPLVGTLHVHTTWRVGAAVLLGAAAVAWGPALAERLRFRALLALAGAGAFAWAFLLAASDGLGRVKGPLVTRYEFLHDVPFALHQHDFLGTFTALAPLYDFHVHAHPPLMLMVFMGMREIGLGGGWPAAIVVIGVGALAAPAALVAVRALAGEPWARRAAPFAAFAPAAVWIATTPDAFYAGVATVGIALFALAASAEPSGRADALALAAGTVLGAALFLTYGITTLGLVVLAIAAYRRALRALVLAGAGVVAVALAFLAGGFWWYDGLKTARELQLAGVYERRPYAQFLVSGPAAFALVVGPAAAVGLGRLRERGVWVLCGAALLGLAFADLSGYARGETERVWLQFAPWLLVAAGAAAGSLRGRQAWLGVQVAAAVALQVAAKSPW